ncbi:MAG: c-type cytochrome [Ruegeria sp.]
MKESAFRSLAAVLVLAASDVAAQDAEKGGELYRHHCAACHGINATGQGPMAGVLVIQPTDLTMLQSSDKEFPTERVVARIDGRDPLVSHGSPMPVYGPFFEGNDVEIKTPAGQQIMTSQPIVDLVEYLKSMQAN